MSPVDRSLLSIFAGEQAEHVAAIRNLLNTDEAVSDDLLRRLHTLKGAARAVGLEPTEKLVHQTEDVLFRVRQGAVEWNAQVKRALVRTLDAIEDILAATIDGRAPRNIDNLLDAAPEPSRVEAPAPTAPQTGELVRVDARRLDDLIRDSSQLLVDTTVEAAETRADQHREHVDDAIKKWQRLRRAATRSARELSRYPEFHAIAECLSFADSQFASLGREAHAMTASSQNAARTLREAAEQIYQSACRIRTMEADAVLGSFGPMVRDLAQQEGKQIVFVSEGMETQADRLVLQGLREPVIHLLRNAVSHGIETPEERTRKGKNPEGTIRLRLRSRGDRLGIWIEDDGRGLDHAAIAQQAQDRGLPYDDTTRVIFQPGFSTSKMVTDVSGRGMGLSVVRRSIDRLRGEVGVYPGRNGGTQVALAVPLSISTQHVLLVETAGHVFGLSASFVESLDRVAPSEVQLVDGRETIVTYSGPVRLARLSDLLQLPNSPFEKDIKEKDIKEEGIKAFPCVILALNERRMAIVVDRFLDERDAIIKDTGLPDSATGLTAGGIPMEDGTVGVMLNVNGLFESFAGTRGAAAVAPLPEPKQRKNRILVVDDSLTTRSLEKSILEAHGFEVQLAVDGLEALERLRADLPDLVISDVMMPRMTGFQLLEKIKEDSATKHLPVILVTSLESREEQQMGLTLGADAYIVKRKFDQRELLSVIRQIL